MKQMTVEKDPPEVLYASFREERVPALAAWDDLTSELRRVFTWLYFQGVWVGSEQTHKHYAEAMEEQRRKLGDKP
jgi:hypothetical protein